MTIADLRQRQGCIKTHQPVSVIGPDGWVTFRVPMKTTVKGHSYHITIAAVDVNGNRVDRSVLLRAGPRRRRRSRRQKK